MSCGVGHRRCSDLAWLWLWCRLAATAPTGPLAWEPPYASGSVLKKRERQNKTNQTQTHKEKNKVDLRKGEMRELGRGFSQPAGAWRGFWNVVGETIAKRECAEKESSNWWRTAKGIRRSWEVRGEGKGEVVVETGKKPKLCLCPHLHSLYHCLSLKPFYVLPRWDLLLRPQNLARCPHIVDTH